MADIAMCRNDTCELSSTCYRYLAIPNQHRQSYASFAPKNGKCDNYWEAEESKKKGIDTNV